MKFRPILSLNVILSILITNPYKFDDDSLGEMEFKEWRKEISKKESTK